MKFWQSPKGDYAGISVIGDLFSTCRSRNTAIGGSSGRTLFQKILKVRKVITLEHPRSADPFGPSIGTRPQWANLFPLRTLKYFEILTKSKRWLRWKIRNRRVVLDLPVERPSWARLFPLRTLKYYEILTKSKRWLRSKIRNRRVVLDLPVERPSWARPFPLWTLKCFEILTKSKRWLHWKIRNRRVVLDLPVEKYLDRRVFWSDTFSKNFESPKGDYAGTSAIGRSVWTEHRDKTPMGESLPSTELEIFWNFDKVQKVITLEDPYSASPSRPASRETFMGASLPTGDFEIFWNFDKVQKVITLEDPESASRSRPAGVETFMGASLPTADFEKCSKSNRSSRWEIPRPQMVLDSARPKRPSSADPSRPAGRERPRSAGLFPLRTLKYFEILTKSQRWFQREICYRRIVVAPLVERDLRPPFSSNVTSLPP